jgi:hypothetical protein
MPRFAVLALARAVVLRTVAGDRDELAGDRQAPWLYRQAMPALGGAEMAERVVSDVIVAECVLRCGGPQRGCGIPTDDLCLLAMHGASRSAAH